jgi:hypothetical protein
MLRNLVLIGINLLIFVLLTYFVNYEVKLDKVCKEIIKDYNWELDNRFSDLKDVSKISKTIDEKVNKIRPVIESMVNVKTLDEADSLSQQAKKVINKLGWDFDLNCSNHRDLGVNIIDQFMEKFEITDEENYDSKLNIVIRELTTKGDSLHIVLTPIFINLNFASIMVNGIEEIHENPFCFEKPVQFVVLKSKLGRCDKFSFINSNEVAE